MPVIFTKSVPTPKAAARPSASNRETAGSPLRNQSVSLTCKSTEPGIGAELPTSNCDVVLVEAVEGARVDVEAASNSVVCTDSVAVEVLLAAVVVASGSEVWMDSMAVEVVVAVVVAFSIPSVEVESEVPFSSGKPLLAVVALAGVVVIEMVLLTVSVVVEVVSLTSLVVPVVVEPIADMVTEAVDVAFAAELVVAEVAASESSVSLKTSVSISSSTDSTRTEATGMVVVLFVVEDVVSDAPTVGAIVVVVAPLATVDAKEVDHANGSCCDAASVSASPTATARAQRPTPPSLPAPPPPEPLRPLVASAPRAGAPAATAAPKCSPRAAARRGRRGMPL
mmetsp:Transcript_42190/g.106249  ORF Transcript_42190/g.106249 Transcript_42190/m.106249 type:complete len:338 (-) Transcript_42190:74-1087(-)